MSVTAIAAVLHADFPKYIDWKKDGVPRRSKGSTAKLVLLCYADKANDEGEGAYPGYERLLVETDLSDQGLADTIECLRQNAFLQFEGRSKWNTNSYTVNIPKLHDLKHELFLKPLEKRFSSHLSRVSQATRVNPLVNPSVKPNGAKPEKPDTTPFGESLKKGREEAKQRIAAQRANRGTWVDWEMRLRSMPNAKKEARLNEIHDEFQVYFGVRPQWSKIKKFAEHIDDREQHQGEHFGDFAAWLLTTYENFDLAYWPWDKMMEHWPRAFDGNIPTNVDVDENGFAEVEKEF